MAKQKDCICVQRLRFRYVKWQGQCHDCGAWNTLTEIKLGPEKGSGRAGSQGRVASLLGLAAVSIALKSLRILIWRTCRDFPRGLKSLIGSSGAGWFRARLFW